MNQSDEDDKVRETNDQTDSSANLDPRIGMRLEDLNKWTGRINALEKSFEEANSNFRLILSESTDRLKCLAIKLGKSVEESRPYYEAKEKLIEVQGKCQRAAINYEKACQAYLEAKERINLAEKKFLTSSSDEFDTTWQEMLNQANIKLMEAETMKKESERLHQLSMKDFHSAETILFNLKKKLKTPLHRSKVYFDEKKRFQKKLVSLKEEIESIISQINRSKACYAATLRELEAISEEIHEKRNCSLIKRLRTQREPGVGSDCVPDGMSSIEMVNSRLSQLGLSLPENGGYPSSKEEDEEGETDEEDDEELPSSCKSSSSLASTSTDAMIIHPSNSCSDIDTICSINEEDDHLQSEKSDSDSINHQDDYEIRIHKNWKPDNVMETDKTIHKDIIHVNVNGNDDDESPLTTKLKDHFFCNLETNGLRNESTPDILNHIKSADNNAFFTNFM
ncbi:SH3 domain-binding protein 5-like [Panonychus citri]|uniref:SH3 domain-binding protein 5-like n=1 Tax=Panonychus citri TaxID=50023 RepID=UPI002307FC5D|nr:SH3 domain-binding protein 5-like [Panonychus citri]